MKIKRILVSQPKPSDDRSPYYDLAKKQNLVVDFRQFISYKMIEGYITTVNVMQRLHHLPEYTRDMSVELEFWGANRERKKEKILIKGKESKQEFLLNFEPIAVIIDPDEKITDSTLDEIKTINKKGKYNFEECKAQIDIELITDTTIFHIQYNPLAPLPVDGFKFHDAYWKIDISTAENIKGILHFIYDTKKNTENLYHKSPNGDWKKVSTQNHINNKIVIFDKIASGEYAIGSKIE